MPETFDDYRHPEQLLPGLDRPRPLSPALRARLEAALLGLAMNEAPAAPAPRPLSPEVRDRLENSLRAPSPAQPGRNWPRQNWPRQNWPRQNWRRRNWRVAPGVGVAAAIAILAAIVVPQLVQSSGKPGSTVAAKAAGPSVARPRFSPAASAAGNGPQGGKGQGAPGGGPGRSGPSRLGPESSGAAPVGPRRLGTVPGPLAVALMAPVVSGVSPRQGPVAGGNWVVVTGRGFVGISAVRFGASSAVDFTVESPVRLKVMAPSHRAGSVDIEVSGPAGRSSTSARDRYTFGG